MFHQRFAFTTLVAVTLAAADGATVSGRDQPPAARPDDTLEINPLLPDGIWDYFCLDQIRYHGRWVTILYDRTGERYRKGRGLRVSADGKEIGAAEIGFRGVDHAQIGLARSRDGISGWQRHPSNPIIRPGENQWDHDACYKPYAVFDGRRWLLWYNGRRGNLEQIGVVFHEGEAMGFE